MIDAVMARLLEKHGMISLEGAARGVRTAILRRNARDRNRLIEEAVMSAIQERMEQRESHAEVAIEYEHATFGDNEVGVHVSYRDKKRDAKE